MPKKVRLQALKIMLSAKLYEGKITVIDSEALKYYKTRYLEAIMKPFEKDRVLILTDFTPDKNFMLASGNIVNITVKNPQTFNIPEMMKSDQIFMTKKGLM